MEAEPRWKQSLVVWTQGFRVSGSPVRGPGPFGQTMSSSGAHRAAGGVWSVTGLWLPLGPGGRGPEKWLPSLRAGEPRCGSVEHSLPAEPPLADALPGEPETGAAAVLCFTPACRFFFVLLFHFVLFLASCIVITPSSKSVPLQEISDRQGETSASNIDTMKVKLHVPFPKNLFQKEC